MTCRVLGAAARGALGQLTTTSRNTIAEGLRGLPTKPAFARSGKVPYFIWCSQYSTPVSNHAPGRNPDSPPSPPWTFGLSAVAALQGQGAHSSFVNMTTTDYASSGGSHDRSDQGGRESVFSRQLTNPLLRKWRSLKRPRTRARAKLGGLVISGQVYPVPMFTSYE